MPAVTLSVQVTAGTTTGRQSLPAGLGDRQKNLKASQLSRWLLVVLRTTHQAKGVTGEVRGGVSEVGSPCSWTSLLLWACGPILSANWGQELGVLERTLPSTTYRYMGLGSQFRPPGLSFLTKRGVSESLLSVSWAGICFAP